MNSIFNRGTTLLVMLVATCMVVAGQPRQPAGKDIIKWYDSHVWLNGLPLQPHGSIDKKEFYKQYHAHKIWWDKAFKYLKETNFTDIKTGEYPIDGDNVFAKITGGALRDQSKKGGWESHPGYADIHYVINGKETIGLVTIPKDYDVGRDSLQYGSKAKYYVADTGTFFIIFTGDAHRPHLKTDGYDTAKKLVIKVRTDL